MLIALGKLSLEGPLSVPLSPLIPVSVSPLTFAVSLLVCLSIYVGVWVCLLVSTPSPSVLLIHTYTPQDLAWALRSPPLHGSWVSKRR